MTKKKKKKKKEGGREEINIHKYNKGIPLSKDD